MICAKNRTVHRILSGLLLLILCLGGFTAHAAHTRPTLVLETATAKPGETVWVALRLQMDPGWHTYWEYPGEFGGATRIAWQLPAGVTAGPVQWPVPEKIADDTGTTYAFHDDVALLIPLQLAADLKTGTLDLTGRVSWIECETACIPGKATVTAQLRIGDQMEPSSEAAAFAEWRQKIPPLATNLAATAAWEKPAVEDARPLIIEWSAASAEAPDFFPHPAENFEVLGKTEVLPGAAGKIRIRKTVQKTAGEWPSEISGLLITKGSAVVAKISVSTGGDSATAASPGTSASPTAATTTAAAAPVSLAFMLVCAFAGGLILNIMPCVFPVIALKIFGFVQQSHDDPRRVFKLGLVYAGGVLVSFLVMAGIVIAIQQGGGSAGWGMQFKNPYLSVGFIAMVILIALNLFGVFEVNLGSGAMGAAGNLASRHGTSGAFFNGVLATVLATPCTAPILASALSYAFTQPPAIILLFFFTIGLGLAFPYVLLSWKPGWLKMLPRPGAWMEKFKVGMGFPMLATAVWIFWFTAPRFGRDGVIWVGLFLVGMAFAVWIYGSFVQHGTQRRGVAGFVALVVLLASYAYTLEAKLDWRKPLPKVAAGQLENKAEGVQWQPWSPEAVQTARAAGRPVIVDFTADWCLTCNKFVKPAVDNAEVRQKLEAINGVALLADYSNYGEDIAAEIRKYHADGAVPLVLVYPRDAAKPPDVLPTIPGRKGVLEALDKAAR